jgi:hypothetical protein
MQSNAYADDMLHFKEKQHQVTTLDCQINPRLAAVLLR